MTEQSNSESMECDLPAEIADEEFVVRTIKTPWHTNKKGLPRPAALRPGPNASAVSVIRRAMGQDFCKDKSVEIAGQAYSGLLVLGTGLVRQAGSTVYDHREDFCGHAHVDHGIPMPAKGVPLDPKLQDELDTRCEGILKDGTFLTDPSPSEPGWSGTAF